jgi:hypothetical protein
MVVVSFCICFGVVQAAKFFGLSRAVLETYNFTAAKFERKGSPGGLTLCRGNNAPPEYANNLGPAI